MNVALDKMDGRRSKAPVASTTAVVDDYGFSRPAHADEMIAKAPGAGPPERTALC
jgi:hypothetical protein